MYYITIDAVAEASPWLAGRSPRAPDLQRTTSMTAEIFYLTAQIQRWLNERLQRRRQG
jgi:hypothetical protein